MNIFQTKKLMHVSSIIVYEVYRLGCRMGSKGRAEFW